LSGRKEARGEVAVMKAEDFSDDAGEMSLRATSAPCDQLYHFYVAQVTRMGSDSPQFT
jgi:hypothetical protein